MPKKTTKPTKQNLFGDSSVVEENIILQNITDTLEKNYMPYTMSVIVSRAIPEIDGFKPSHRKLLFTMYKMGLLNGQRLKSNDVVGQTMRLNPHGDGAIYETLVRLARGNEALLHPFVDSKGNFGKQYSRDMSYAASRYTEVKLDAICQELFKDIEKDTVDFEDNYSSTMQEPVLFPTTFPNILVNPNQGIAVGMASNICSFNLKEVCSFTIAYLKDSSADLHKYITAPDFSTGGQLIYDKKKLDEIYETGRGSFKLRAKYRFDDKNSCIEITEIPYTTNIEVIIEKIITLIKSAKIKDINDVRDETDLGGLKIAIDVKRGCKPDILMHKLYSMTPLEDSFNCNFNILVDKKPRTMGIKGILGEWINFRQVCVRRRIAYDIAKKEEKFHLLEGLKKILLDIDKAIKIIRNTEEDSEVVPNLMKGFLIDEIQAEYIAEIKLRNLNRQYILRRTDELDALSKEISELKDTLNDTVQIRNLIIADLKEVSRKYGKERRTDIVYADDVPEISEEDLIEDYEIKLYMTEHNYFKKISSLSMRFSGEHKLKEDDNVVLEITATNRADVIMFSNRRNAYKLKAHEIPDTKASNLGEYLPNMLNLEDGEKIIYITTTTDYSGNVIFVYDNGKVAKVQLQSYATKTNRKKLVNAYSDRGNILLINAINEDVDVLLIRASDKATLFNTSLLQEKAAKNATGIQVYTLKKNSLVSKALLLPLNADDYTVDDIEYYRAKKIPTTGHFIKEKDKAAITQQMMLS